MIIDTAKPYAVFFSRACALVIAGFAANVLSQDALHFREFDLDAVLRIDRPAGQRPPANSLGGQLILQEPTVVRDVQDGKNSIAGGAGDSGRPAAVPLPQPPVARKGNASAPATASPADAARAASSPEPYIDQLIDPGLAAREIDEDYREVLEQSQGRRFFSADYLHYQKDQDRFGDSMEDGVRLRLRRETLNYGELDLEAALRSDRPAGQRQQDNSVGGQLTLRQYGLALANGWTMDNAAGVIRSKADPGLTSTFRINLPTSLVGGIQTRLHSDNQDIRLNVGKIGGLGTGQIQDFETREGWLASAGYSRLLNPLWRTAVHLVALRDHDTVDDHQSAAGLVEYRSLDRRHQYQAHTLVDSKGNYGVWLDADDRIGRWRHRYGAFYLRPDLLWTNSQISNDEQGLYARSELHRLRYFISTGLDVRDTNIKDDPDRTSTTTVNGFASGTWRYRRKISVGGTLGFRDAQVNGSPDDEDRRNLRLTGFVSQRSGFGTTRLQASVSRVEQGDDNGQGYAVDLDQSWDVSRSLQLSGTLSREKTEDVLEDEERNSASILFRHQFGSNLNWNGDFTYTQLDDSFDGDQDTYNASVGLFWHFKPHWDANLRMVWNRTDDDPDIGTDPDYSEEEKTLLLTFRYARSSGRPFEVIGSGLAGNGYGEINGQVFFDENRDGERQAGEPVASGVVVVLDRRYERITDAEGRFSFVPVTAGDHRASILVEDLPLPWGLEDETPRTVHVSVRGKVQIDFALARIDQQLALGF